MKSKLLAFLFLLFSGIGYSQSPHDPILLFAQDEGATLSGSFRAAGRWGIDCVGSGITCAWNASLSKVTLTVGGGSGSGITQLNGQTGATQTFSRVNDTNVTLTIASAANDHGFTVAWTGTLAPSRGGTGQDSSAATGVAQVTAGTWSFSNAPTFTDFTNAAHDHGDADDGGSLGTGTVGAAQVTDGSLTADDLGADSVSASELNATGVEAELEAVLDLQDLQGAVTDAQVPNTITIDLAATATALAADPANCSAGQVAGGVTAAGVAESCLDPIVSTEIDTVSELNAILTDENAGTDLTADLEEEAHVTEHAENGADELVGESLGTACSENQILKANASGGLDCAADADSGGSTAFNAIGDAAADGSIDLVGTEQDIIAQNDTANDEILEITNQDADRANAVTTLRISDYDQDDAEATPFEIVSDIDGTPRVDLAFNQSTGLTSVKPINPPAEAYNESNWNSDTGAPQKDAVRDQFEAEPSATRTFTNKTIDCEGTGNSCGTVSKIQLDFASCSGAAAFLNWNDEASGVAAPTAACNDAGTTQKPSADFSGTVDNALVWTLKLPSDWNGSSEIDLALRYVSVAASPSGDTRWTFGMVCRAVGENWDSTYNELGVTDTVSSQNFLNDASVTTSSIGSVCNAGEDLTIRARRDADNAADTNDDLAKALYLELTLRRTQ